MTKAIAEYVRELHFEFVHGGLLLTSRSPKSCCLPSHSLQRLSIPAQVLRQISTEAPFPEIN